MRFLHPEEAVLLAEGVSSGRRRGSLTVLERCLFRLEDTLSSTRRCGLPRREIPVFPAKMRPGAVTDRAPNRVAFETQPGETRASLVA